jgi:hypothetical protein
LNRQGNDRGRSYRSAIFYTSEEQKRIANETIADVEASGLWCDGSRSSRSLLGGRARTSRPSGALPGRLQLPFR